MAETLLANGDGDDYFDAGLFELEVYANSGLDMQDVSGARQRSAEGRRAYSVMPAAGFLAVHKRMPEINHF
jgi:hypothetical protein